MTTAILVFVLMLAVVTVMAVGVLFGRSPIKGSCGGMSALGMETECDVCGGDQQKCDEESGRLVRSTRAAASGANLGYDAGQGGG